METINPEDIDGPPGGIGAATDEHAIDALKEIYQELERTRAALTQAREERDAAQEALKKIDEAANDIINRRYEIGIPELQEIRMQKIMGRWTIMLYDDARDVWSNNGIEEDTISAAIIAVAQVVNPHVEYLP